MRPQFIPFVAFLLLVAACQTTPANVSETIGQGYASLTTVAHDVQGAFASQVIDSKQANSLKADLQQAKNTLDAASTAYAAGDAAGAQGAANQAHIIIQAVIAGLTAAEKKHGP